MTRVLFGRNRSKCTTSHRILEMTYNRYLSYHFVDDIRDENNKILSKILHIFFHHDAILQTKLTRTAVLPDLWKQRVLQRFIENSVEILKK